MATLGKLTCMSKLMPKWELMIKICIPYATNHLADFLNPNPVGKLTLTLRRVRVTGLGLAQR